MCAGALGPGDRGRSPGEQPPHEPDDRGENEHADPAEHPRSIRAKNVNHRCLISSSPLGYLALRSRPKNDQLPNGHAAFLFGLSLPPGMGASGAAISEHLHASTTVVTGTSNCLAIVLQLNPSLRSRIASSRRNTRRGRPSVLPFARAARTPAMVSSRMRETSISAKALITWRKNRLVGLLSSVSIFCVTAMKRMPSDTSSWMLRMESTTERPPLSSFPTRTGTE